MISSQWLARLSTATLLIPCSLRRVPWCLRCFSPSDTAGHYLGQEILWGGLFIARSVCRDVQVSIKLKWSASHAFPQLILTSSRRRVFYHLHFVSAQIEALRSSATCRGWKARKLCSWGLWSLDEWHGAAQTCFPTETPYSFVGLSCVRYFLVPCIVIWVNFFGFCCKMSPSTSLSW